MRSLLGATLGQIVASRKNATPTFIGLPEQKSLPDEKPLPVFNMKRFKKADASIVVDKKPEEKKPDPPQKPRMKKWPEDPTALLDYADIVAPLKAIIVQGYRLFRKDEVKEFEYTGYNIGAVELQHSPPPKYRFTEKLLAFENKRGKKLIDVVLNVVFLLGVEQGRRAERRDEKPMELVVETMKKYREDNKNLRIKVDELAASLEVREEHPSLIGDELKTAIKDATKRRRSARLLEAKKELQIDPTRNVFDINSPERAKFKELEKLAASLNKNTCSIEQWKAILADRGWGYDDWVAKCKKKFAHNDFSG